MKFNPKPNAQENTEAIPKFLKKRNTTTRLNRPPPVISETEKNIGCFVMVLLLVMSFFLGYYVQRWTTQNPSEAIVDESYATASASMANLNGLRMTQVPPGTYTTGPPKGLKKEDDAPLPPREKITFQNPFWISRYEITKGQWEQVMGTRPWASRRNVHADPDTPAIYVSYYDAREFCERLSLATGRTWRLPSSIEWEYAARAGTDAEYIFSGVGDQDMQLRTQTVWRLFRYQEFPWAPWVGKGDCNAWGLHDVMDNVSEWCIPLNGDTSTDTAILRGSHWRIIAAAPLWTVHLELMHKKSDCIGFRVVCEGPGPGGPEDALFSFSDIATDDEATVALTRTQSLRYWHPDNVRVHPGNINAIAVSPEGDWAVSICEDMKLKLWSIADQTKQGEWHTGIPWHKVRLSKDGRFAAMTDAFKGLSEIIGLPYEITMTQLLDLHSGEDVRQFDDECLDLCFSPDGNRFAFLGLENLEIFDTDHWKTPVQTISGFSGDLNYGEPVIAGFSPDAESIVILSASSRHTYRVADGALIGKVTVEASDWFVEKAALHIGEPALALAANGVNARFVRFWQDRADEPAFGPPIPPRLEARHFSADGRCYLEYNRNTGLHVMTVPFFAETQRIPVPLDDFVPVPGCNAIVAAAGRCLFLLRLDAPEEIGYFVDDPVDLEENAQRSTLTPFNGRSNDRKSHSYELVEAFHQSID